VCLPSPQNNTGSPRAAIHVAMIFGFDRNGRRARPNCSVRVAFAGPAHDRSPLRIVVRIAVPPREKKIGESQGDAEELYETITLAMRER